MALFDSLPFELHERKKVMGDFQSRKDALGLKEELEIKEDGLVKPLYMGSLSP